MPLVCFFHFGLCLGGLTLNLGLLLDHLQLRLLQVGYLCIHCRLHLLVDQFLVALGTQVRLKNIVSKLVQVVHSFDEAVFLFLFIHVQLFADSILMIPVVFFGQEWVIHRAHSTLGAQNIVRQLCIGLLLLHRQHN